ncbi:MAG: hypothetical protein D6771_07340 [Zetaproteobacteria bacterium]|nr:MAG: hypothetical protein D6771_07340 [Zetaproteobacteria bacterium]
MRTLGAALTLAALAVVAPPVHAGILDWLEAHKPAQAAHGKRAPAPHDDARLLTLEPHEQELFPKAGPDGKHFLVWVHGRKADRVDVRLLENGDPVATAVDDEDARWGFFWWDADEVAFLSRRAGGLALWRKPALHPGLIARVLALDGDYILPQRAADGSVIAVRVRRERAAPPPKDPFFSWRLPGAVQEIVRILPDGQTQKLAEGLTPAVSPDGQWIAFAMPAGRSVHLFVMRADGSELAQLTSGRFVDVEPAWSADGRWIVFTSNRAGAHLRDLRKSSWDIWAVSRDGTKLVQLTKDPARDGAPSVAPNGLVLFHSDRKVSPEEARKRDLKRAPRGFHIWAVRLPQ